jgi:hypothetical protein
MLSQITPNFVEVAFRAAKSFIENDALPQTEMRDVVAVTCYLLAAALSDKYEKTIDDFGVLFNCRLGKKQKMTQTAYRMAKFSENYFNFPASFHATMKAKYGFVPN